MRAAVRRLLPVSLALLIAGLCPALLAAEPPGPEDPPGMVGALRRLCGAAVKAVPASGAGLSVMTEGGVRGMAAASDAATATARARERAIRRVAAAVLRPLAAWA